MRYCPEAVLPMFQVITIGSALVDIFVHSSQFASQSSERDELLCLTSGDKLDIEGFRVFSGGGATNTAVGFQRLGFQTGIICELGRDDLAQIILNDLKRERVMTQLVIAEKKEQTGGSIILVDQVGGRTVLVHRGAASLLDTYDISPFWLSQTRWVHLSSIAGRLPALEKIFQTLTRSHEVGLSWNPGKTELELLRTHQLKLSEIPCQIFFVNQEEWQLLGSVQAEVLENFSEVVVTAGKAGGMVYVSGKPAWKFLSQSQSVVADETGAGDAFATGFVSAKILGHSTRIAIAWGVKNAGSVISYYGAKLGLLDRDRLIRAVAEVGDIETRLETENLS
ncbi:MAG TPA: hypothetical protein DEP87_04490 [Candidatus Pacebacteria bacterium]|nr:hypothetical protein [Candidatus Paceibacterota bacterium]